jgi:GTP1/Obg family GTP-binding protein
VYIGIILIICGVSLLCIDHVSANISSYYADVEKSTSIINSVNYNYSVFKEKAYSIKNDISDVADGLNSFYEDFINVQYDIDLKMSRIKDEIDSLSLMSKDLIDNCSYNINDDNTKTQCNNFYTNYLNMINSYEKMIEEYNYYVNSYNKYAYYGDLDTIELCDRKLDSSVFEIVEMIEGDKGE